MIKQLPLPVLFVAALLAGGCLETSEVEDLEPGVAEAPAPPREREIGANGQWGPGLDKDGNPTTAQQECRKHILTTAYAGAQSVCCPTQGSQWGNAVKVRFPGGAAKACGKGGNARWKVVCQEGMCTPDGPPQPND